VNNLFSRTLRLLGHELGAEIIGGGKSTNHLRIIRDKVAVEPYLNCGNCQPCRMGKNKLLRKYTGLVHWRWHD
jgi:threonine dehydrogenase-like Zn-dependent dehydrogenase